MAPLQPASHALSRTLGAPPIMSRNDAKRFTRSCVQALLLGVIGFTPPGFNPFFGNSIQQRGYSHTFAPGFVFNPRFRSGADSPAIHLCFLHALQCSALPAGDAVCFSPLNRRLVYTPYAIH